MLEVQDLTVQFGSLTIVNNLSFKVEEQEWLMIVGPNGAGKSTLIDAMTQGTAYKGLVRFMGEDVAKFPPAKRAKCMGVLLQSHSVGYSFTIEEVVKLGRYAYSKGIFSTTSDEDMNRVRETMELTGIWEIRKQSVLTLSGGELQRVFLAQLLAQSPKILILDEPANHLDLVYQKQVFNLVREWAKQGGRAVISVVHDLSLARAYGTNALLLDKGNAIAQGKSKEVLCPKNLEKAYSMDVFAWMQSMLAQWQV